MAKRVVNEGLITKIRECQTFAELASLKSQYVVVGIEKSVVFEKKLELIDEQLEFTTNCTGPWGLEQRQQFEIEWRELVNSWRKTS